MGPGFRTSHGRGAVGRARRLRRVSLPGGAWTGRQPAPGDGLEFTARRANDAKRHRGRAREPPSGSGTPESKVGGTAPAPAVPGQQGSSSLVNGRTPAKPVAAGGSGGGARGSPGTRPRRAGAWDGLRRLSQLIVAQGPDRITVPAWPRSSSFALTGSFKRCFLTLYASVRSAWWPGLYCWRECPLEEKGGGWSRSGEGGRSGFRARKGGAVGLVAENLAEGGLAAAGAGPWLEVLKTTIMFGQSADSGGPGGPPAGSVCPGRLRCFRGFHGGRAPSNALGSRWFLGYAGASSSR